MGIFKHMGPMSVRMLEAGDGLCFFVSIFFSIKFGVINFEAGNRGMTRLGNERIDTVKNSNSRVVCCGVRVTPLVRSDVFCRAALYHVFRPLSK